MLEVNQILVPTDLSPRSLFALDYAVAMAQHFSAILHLVYVHEPLPRVSDLAWQGVEVSELDEEQVRRARSRLRDIVSDHVKTDVAIEVDAVTGRTASAIVTAARKKGADLIVMATHGRTGLKHVLMGSTAEAVIRRSPCPVLVLRQPLTAWGEATAAA